MAYISSRVTDCYVALVGAGVSSEKHILKKAAASNPFTDYSIGDKVRVYNGDYSTSGDLYVLRDGYDLGGGVWGMVLGSTQISLADYSDTYGTTNGSGVWQTWSGNESDPDEIYLWGGLEWATFVEDGSCPSAFGHWEVPTAYNAHLFYAMNSSEIRFYRLSNGDGLGVWNYNCNSPYDLTVTPDSNWSNFPISQTNVGFLWYDGLGDDLWDVFSADTTDITIGLLSTSSDTAGGGIVCDVYTDIDSALNLPVPLNGEVSLPRAGLKGKEMYVVVRSPSGLELMDSFKLNSIVMEYQRGGDRT